MTHLLGDRAIFQKKDREITKDVTHFILFPLSGSNLGEKVGQNVQEPHDRQCSKTIPRCADYSLLYRNPILMSVQNLRSVAQMAMDEKRMERPSEMTTLSPSTNCFDSKGMLLAERIVRESIVWIQKYYSNEVEKVRLEKIWIKHKCAGNRPQMSHFSNSPTHCR